MYYQNYEDYMRSILGYPIQNNINYNDTYNNTDIRYEYLTNVPRYSNEILDLYPEIYKIINPMVCKICEANSKPITRELVEQMTDEIYLNIESDTTIEDEVINVRVNLPQAKLESNENRQSQKNSQNTNNSTSRRIRDNRQENRNNNRVEEPVSDKSLSQNRENRQIRRRNNTLRDLIKILILNQLLGRGRPPHRPPRPNPPRSPFPGGPGPNPRPPFPGGPGQNPRPPIMPRDMNNNNLI